jgi:hypothetical protein
MSGVIPGTGKDERSRSSWCTGGSRTHTRNEAVNCEPYANERLRCWNHPGVYLSSALLFCPCDEPHTYLTGPQGLVALNEGAAPGVSSPPSLFASTPVCAEERGEDARARRTIHLSYSLIPLLRASIAIQRKKTPRTEPAKPPFERTCHDFAMKHESTVFQFHSIETGISRSLQHL